jgi:hypothetical protein
MNEPQIEWISMRERMPKSNGEYLFLTTAGVMQLYWTVDDSPLQVAGGFAAAPPTNSPSHWAEVPPGL